MATISPMDSETVAALFGAAAVIERLKHALGVKSDSQLADVLKTSRQNISKWKSRNVVPYEQAVLVALNTGVSLDYLLSGIELTANTDRLPSNLDPAFLKAALRNLLKAGMFNIPKGRDVDETLDAAAFSIRLQYDRAESVLYQLVIKDELPLMTARSAAIVAAESFGPELTKRTAPVTRQSSKKKGPQ